jgi:hypothetical protein
MKLVSRLAVAAAFALSSSAAAQPVAVAGPVSGSSVINFNSISDFTSLSNQFAGLGVSIVSSCFMTNNNFAGDFGGDPMQATNFDQHAEDCAGGSNYFPSVTFNFSSTIGYFGLNGISNGNITLTNANGFVSGFSSVPNPANFVGFTDATGFNSVTITADVNNAFAIDDVSFTSTVPEPSSIALVAAGMLAVAAAACLKRAVS